MLHRCGLGRILAGALLLFSLGSAPPRGAEVSIGVDSRVELLSIVFRLAGAFEYNMGALSEYNQAIDRHFAAFREHDAVRLARRYREEDGVSFDAVMSLAVQLGPFPALDWRIPFDAPYRSLDRRWRPARADSFLVALRAFASESDAAGFFRSQGALREEADARLRALVKTQVDPGWFETFFGSRPQAAFHVVPGLGNGGASYGPRFVDADGSEELYAIVGASRTDSTGMPVFDDDAAATIAHEFSHSFVNPVVRRAAPSFDGAEAAYAQVREIMQRQAYATAETMVDESLVRAATIHWVRAEQGEAAARRRIIDEEARGFYWMGELVDTLGAWERRRGPGESFDALAPRLAAWFDRLGPRVESLRAAFDSRRPRIVEMTPAPGDSLVDPGLTRLTIRFDGPMQPAWSFMYAPEDTNRSAWPKIDSPSLDSTGTTLTAAIELQSDHPYAFVMNRATGGGFQSSEGYPLAITPVEFRTKRSP